MARTFLDDAYDPQPGYEESWANAPSMPKPSDRRAATRSFNPAALAAAARGDHANALVAATPGGIEAQEAAGQQELVAGSSIPKEIHGATRKQLKKLGFVFGKDVDELFVSVELPKGWSIRATKHSMHNDVIDSKGANRAHIFYKAAFYDRRADMQMVCRYNLISEYLEGLRQVCVKDEQTGGKVFQGGICAEDDYAGGRLQDDEARAWLDEKFPDHKGALAYWD